MTDVAGNPPVLLALLGHPVGHSVSPAVHDAALRAAGLRGVYVARDVPDHTTLDRVMEGLGPLGFTGANVTVPHKQAVAGRCDHLSSLAVTVGAVNTVVVGHDGLTGHNTDVAGFMSSLPADLTPGRAMVVGAGGAARAVVVGLVRAGWRVDVAARRPAQAQELVAATAGDPDGAAGDTTAADTVRAVDLAASAFGAAVTAADLVVNATPLGLGGERLPDPAHDLAADQVACDLVYNPLETPFLRDAARNGAPTVDGLGMLIGQAAASLRLWLDIEPDIDAMRHAALDQL